jgi:hypothetical protein
LTLLNLNFFQYLEQGHEQKALNVVQAGHLTYYTQEKDTALHFAVRKGFANLAEKLVQLGADPCTPNAKNETPLDIAVNENQAITIQKILNSTGKRELVGHVVLSIAKDNRTELIKNIFTNNSLTRSSMSDQSISSKIPLHESELFNDYDLYLKFDYLRECLNAPTRSQIQINNALKKCTDRTQIVANRLTAKMIVSLFDVFSKLDSTQLKSIEFMLEILIAYATSMLNEFSPQDIAILFRLISKLDNPHASKWQPMLSALTECLPSIPAFELTNVQNPNLQEITDDQDPSHSDHSSRSISPTENPVTEIHLPTIIGKAVENHTIIQDYGPEVKRDDLSVKDSFTDPFAITDCGLSDCVSSSSSTDDTGLIESVNDELTSPTISEKEKDEIVFVRELCLEKCFKLKRCLNDHKPKAQIKQTLEECINLAVSVVYSLKPKEIATLSNVFSKLKSWQLKSIEPKLKKLMFPAIAIASDFHPTEIALLFNFISKLDNPNSPEWREVLAALAKRAVATAHEFKPQEIAMVFNLISKLDNPNSPEWREMLAAFAERAVSTAHEFKPQEIALVFNLISKLDNPNSQEWREMLAALGECAVATAHEFKPQGIGMVFNLIFKLDNPNSPEWREMLAALGERAVATAHEFKPQEIGMVFNLIFKLDNPNSPEWREMLATLGERAVATAHEFKPQEIGMVFNLISKLDNPNSPEWREMLAALGERAVATAHEFKPQGIGMVFNLVSKLDNPNSPKWREMLAALAERAVATAHQFKPQGIGLVFNLVSKLDNPNSPEWREMLAALAERAVATAHQFKPQGIGLVFNLVSKLDNPNSQEWREMLAALGERAVATAHQFKPQEIGMVFNLIAKLDNPNSPEWREMLAALAERAVSTAHQFKPQDIALVFNLISKLDNPHATSWGNLLMHIEKNTRERWENYCVSLKRTNQQSKQFANPNYQDFFQTIISQKIDFDELETLGEVVKCNDAYYFTESTKCKQYATHFLQDFWSIEENVKQTMACQHNKCKEKHLDQEIQAMYPSCISFVSVGIKGQEFCLVSTSLPSDESLTKILEEFTFNYRLKGSKTIFVYLKNNLQDFNNLIIQITRDPDAKNVCTEKQYAKSLTKLFLKYGDQMKVKGAVNCNLYPYQVGKRYGMCENSADFLVKPILSGNRAECGNNIYTNFIPCCPQCMSNKNAILSVLKTAQNCGSERLKKGNGSLKQVRSLSPLRNSTQRFSPLFENL